jgi:CheY-like chemotaxis protein
VVLDGALGNTQLGGDGATGEAAPRVAPPAQRAAAADDAPPCAHLCVAVIEDDGEVRDSLAALLRRWGHTVIAGEDEAQVRQAHRAAGTGRVQAVIADYRLRDPARPGDTQAAALRAALGPEAALLVVSGDTAPERLRAFNASGATWLSKPVQPARLRSWLASVATRAEATPR